MRRDYKLGIYNWFGFLLPFNERLKLIKNAGFDSTVLWWEDEAGDFPVDKHDMPHMVRDAGLDIENIHAPFNSCNDFWNGDARRRDAVVDLHVSWLKDCRRHGISTMVMHITDGRHPPAFNGYGAEAVRKIVGAAERLGIKVALENTACQEYVPAVLSQIDSPYLGFCYDSSHDWLLSSDNADILRKLRHRLFAVHFSDNDGIDDRHWLPGEGVVNWPLIGSVFPSDSFTGALMLEVHPKAGDLVKPPEAFLEKAYESAGAVRRIIRKG